MDEQEATYDTELRTTNITASFIAGYLSGVGHICVAHPADTLKVSDI